MSETYKIPISVKGIVFQDDSVWLRKNERGEWELPGGKLDEGEQPKETIIREIEEELGFEVKVKDLIQADMTRVEGSSDESNGVLVLAYLCEFVKKVSDFETEGEAGASEFKLFPISEIDYLNMLDFFKEAIKKAHSLK